MQLELTGAGSAGQDEKIASLEAQVKLLTEMIENSKSETTVDDVEESPNG
jgi:hypothetical protein